MHQSSTKNHSLAHYKQAIAKVPLLSAVQEQALAQTIEEGWLEVKSLETSIDQGSLGSPIDRDCLHDRVALVKRRIDRAKKQLIEANLRLVLSLAKKYKDRGVALPDLIQEGNLGLIKAVEHFDYHLGYRFSTYASWRIREALIQAIYEQARTVRIPVYQLKSMHRLNKGQARLAQHLGREPTCSELVKHLACAHATLCEMLQLKDPVSSYTDCAGLETEPSLASPPEIITRQALKSAMQKSLATLKPREAQVLRLRFGVDSEDHTLEAIGNTFGITRERVRQIESAALTKLRRASKKGALQGFLDKAQQA